MWLSNTPRCTQVAVLITLLMLLLTDSRALRAQAPSLGEIGAIESRGIALFREGRYQEVEPLWNRVLDAVEKIYGPDHPATATSLSNLAELYVALGRLSEALPLHRRALAIREKALGAEHTEVAASLNNLAGLLWSQGQYAEAEPLYLRALAIWQKAQGPEHADVATGLHNLANLYQTQGRYVEAEPLLRRALSIREKVLGQEHPWFAASLNNLANLCHSLGRYAEAEQLHRRSLAIKRKVLGPEHVDVATTLNNLAYLYHSEGQYAEAEPLYLRVVAIREKGLGPEHADVAAALNNLAVLYEQQGRLAEAEPLHRRALTIKEKGLGSEHIDVAGSLNNLAELYRKQERLAESESLQRRALAIKEKALGPVHDDVAKSLNNLAVLSVNQGRLAEGEQLHRRALEIREKLLGPEHPDTLRSLMNLAQLSFSQGRDDEALTAMRRLSAALRARASTIDNRASDGAGGEVRFANNTLALLAALAAKVSDPARRAALTAEAFEAAQIDQAKSTSAAVARMSARFAGGSDRLSSIVRQRQDAISRRQALDKLMIKTAARRQSRLDVQEEQRLRAEIAGLDGRIKGFDGTLARDFPGYAEIASPSPVPIADIQALLAADEAVLVYQLAADWILKDTSFLWVLRRGRVELFKLPVGRAELEKSVAALRDTLDPSMFDPRNIPPFPVATGYELYGNVVAPAVQVLEGAKHLFIVPDGALQSLPFSVLVTEKPGSSGSATPPKWLIHRYAVTTLPSVSSLRALRTHVGASGKAREPFAGFGDPALLGHTNDRKGPRAASLYRGNIADASAVRSLDALPESADELRAMALALGSKGDAIWLREQATETRAKKEDLSKYRVLAFATHGIMAGQFHSYGEPALVMTPPKRATELDDGLLGASEVAQLKLNADWVILSACNTAATDGTPGAEGLSGLAKAFFYAGARSLLVSHWPVESISSARLTMGAVSAFVQEPGIGRGEAMRRSMLALMNDPTYSHPIFWAPFVVVGEGGAGR